MDYIKYNKILGVLVGGTLVGVGIGICNLTGLGADPLTVFYVGFAKHFNMSVSNASWIIAFLSILLVLVIDKCQIGVATFIIPFLTKLGIEFAGYLNSNHIDRYMYFYFILGLLVLALGIATTIRANMGKGSNDALISSVANKTDKKYFQIRWIIDLIYLGIGILLGGSFTIGTIISIIILGRMINYFTDFQIAWK